MVNPTSKPYNSATLIDYAKRKLGAPVVEINVDDQQCADVVADALQWMTAYSSDFQSMVYIKHRITQRDLDRRYIDMNEVSGSGTTANGVNTVVGIETDFTNDFAPGVTQITIGGETHNVASVIDATHLTISGTWAANNTQAPIIVTQDAERILGINRILPLGSSLATGVGDWNIQYQFIAQNIQNFTSLDIAPYVEMRQHLELINLMLTGNTLIRFTKAQNKLFLDTDWTRLQIGQYILAECWGALNADANTLLWNDRYLKLLTTQLLKLQWAINLNKYNGLQLPGGVTINSEEWKRDATAEILRLQTEIQEQSSEPPEFYVG